MSKLLPQPGRAYSFRYPRHNYQGIPSHLEVRCVLVTSVRDTRREELDPQTVSLNPSLQRGRWLVIGEDLDKSEERSFYVESMHDIHLLSPEEQHPFRDSEYVVLSPRGRTEFATRDYGASLAFLEGRRFGVLCKVLVSGPATR